MEFDHLVVVAGPTAAGKSTLIRDMLAGALPELEARLGAGHLTGWTCGHAYSDERSLNSAVDHMIVEYDFLWHDLDGKQPREDRGLFLLAAAKKLFFITL